MTTATKHTPATPLPWGEAGQLYSNARRVVHKGNPVVDANGPNAPADVTYIAHAANAYPRLVAALRGTIEELTHHDLGGLGDQCMADARALLRDLGESE